MQVVENWSDDVSIVRLGDDPQFTDYLDALGRELMRFSRHVVLDFSTVRTLNSSNISKLLRLRQRLQTSNKSLILCSLGNHVWGTMMVTGLDTLFKFHENVPTALAILQMQQSKE